MKRVFRMNKGKFKFTHFTFGMTACVICSIGAIVFMALELPTEIVKPEIRTYVTTDITGNTWRESQNNNSYIVEETTERADFPIDINVSEKSALMQLSGIGNTLADRIIGFRDGGNYFYSVDDLTNILGIGQSILDKNIGKIMVRTELLPPRETAQTPDITLESAPITIETTDSKTVVGIETFPVSTEKTRKATETAARTSEAETERPVRFPLEINSCTEEELQLLKGIGPVTARKIIAYRTKNGCFYTIEELMNVSGIGPATLEKIKNSIYVDELNLPERPETSAVTTTTAATTAETTTTTPPPIQPVNLNTGTAEEFAKLPGMTAEIAQKIVNFREEIGGSFPSMEMLLFVDGFTEQIYNDVIKYLFL